MLRYKNSLLERILLEKGQLVVLICLSVITKALVGIDVQAELRVKNSPHLGPTKPPAAVSSHTSPMQRAVMNRHQAARSHSASGIPSLQPVNTMTTAAHQNTFPHPSAFGRNASQSASPSTTRSPGYTVQTVMSSPTSAYLNNPMHSQQRPRSGPHRGSFSQHSSGAGSASGSMATPPGPMQGESLIPYL